MKYKCPICSKEISSDLIKYVGHTEDHIVDEIKKGNPKWVEEDGMCSKCLEYFKEQIRGKKLQ